ncbi:hypothetical protein JOS77_09450 [Chromobacterium haemolyticum]|nr:hypothetical protein JOS77_09450 [Chromobacterium haemolyticum]
MTPMSDYNAPDPHAWLENLDDPAAAEWVAEQNARAQARLDADPRFAGLRDEILAHLRDTRQIPFCAEHDGWLYNFHQDEAHPRGIYRRTTLAAYRAVEQDWQIVLDIDALAEAADEDWYLDGVSHCTLAPLQAMVHLTAGGGDAGIAREYDLAAGAWRGRFQLSGRQEPCGLAGSGQRLGLPRLAGRAADPFRLSARSVAGGARRGRPACVEPGVRRRRGRDDGGRLALPRRRRRDAGPDRVLGQLLQQNLPSDRRSAGRPCAVAAGQGRAGSLSAWRPDR